jgi:hypothetical protein
MKKIKLLSAVALSIFAASAMSSVVSANDTKTSVGSASFKEDTSLVEPKLPGENGGGKKDPDSETDLTNPDKGPDVYTPVGKNELGIVQRPSIFNFGETILTPNSKRTGVTVKALAQNVDGTAFSDKYGDKSYIQYVTVYDGRIGSNGWELSASASELTDAKTSKKLTGATISIAGTTRWNEDADAGKGPNTNLTGSDFMIKTDGTSAKVMETATAKYESDVIFKSTDVSLTVPGSSVQMGDFSSTVTWTLVAVATP